MTDLNVLVLILTLSFTSLVLVAFFAAVSFIEVSHWANHLDFADVHPEIEVEFDGCDYKFTS